MISDVVFTDIPDTPDVTCCYLELSFAEYMLSHVQLFVTPWTASCHAPLSMGFSRQEYWSGLPFPPPGDLPDPGIKPRSIMGRWILYY